MPEGYDALRSAAAWLDLSDRGRVFAAGRDRARLLHNITTNHIKGLAPGQGCYAFLLTPQGRIQADLHILCLEDRFLLDTEPETRERVLQLVRKYIIADDVKLEDVSAELLSVAVEGPGSAAVMAAAGAPAPEADYEHAAWNGSIVARVSATGQPGYRIFVAADRKAEAVAALEAAGAAPASAEAARLVRLENGIPRYGEDILETSLPQETRQMHAVHFNKGCYLGQEIVERIRARGHVNRVLAKVLVEGTDVPAPGAALRAGAEEAGQITSAAFSPGTGRAVALAYLRTAYANPGTALTLESRPAEVA